MTIRLITNTARGPADEKIEPSMPSLRRLTAGEPSIFDAGSAVDCLGIEPSMPKRLVYSQTVRTLQRAIQNEGAANSQLSNACASTQRIATTPTLLSWTVATGQHD